MLTERQIILTSGGVWDLKWYMVFKNYRYRIIFITNLIIKRKNYNVLSPAIIFSPIHEIPAKGIRDFRAACALIGSDRFLSLYNERLRGKCHQRKVLLGQVLLNWGTRLANAAQSGEPNSHHRLNTPGHDRDMIGTTHSKTGQCDLMETSWLSLLTSRFCSPCWCKS